MRLNEQLFKDAIWRLKKSPYPNLPHQWQSSSALETGRWEVPGSISSHACRPSCSEYSVVFSETPVNTAWHSLERPPYVLRSLLKRVQHEIQRRIQTCVSAEGENSKRLKIFLYCLSFNIVVLHCNKQFFFSFTDLFLTSKYRK